jgi:WD40 repeat protein
MMESGRILAAGTSKTLSQCGTFEVDPATPNIRTLLSGAILDCGGGGGPVAPDGKRALNPLGKELSVIELDTGAVHAIKGVPGRTQPNDTAWVHNTAWSPDGKWISAILPDKEIVLIDAGDTARRKKLGHSDGSPVVWSPDSRFLLRSKSEFRCTGFLYFDSLETIDVGTGQRHAIPSSHCEVSGWIGWIDANVVR